MEDFDIGVVEGRATSLCRSRLAKHDDPPGPVSSQGDADLTLAGRPVNRDCHAPSGRGLLEFGGEHGYSIHHFPLHPCHSPLGSAIREFGQFFVAAAPAVLIHYVILKYAACPRRWFLVDFSTLKVPTQEERARRDAARQAEAFARDDAERDGKSKSAIVLTLVHEPEMRALPSGDRIMVLRGTQDRQTNPSVAAYILPPRVNESDEASEAFNGRMRALGGGDKVTLAGNWSKRVWKSPEGKKNEAWEFKAQHFAEGRMSLERLMEKVRSDRGETVEASAEGVQPSQGSPRRGRASSAARDGGMGI